MLFFQEMEYSAGTEISNLICFSIYLDFGFALGCYLILSKCVAVGVTGSTVIAGIGA